MDVDMATVPDSFDTFHFFSRLPPELRLRIWDFSIPAARLVAIHCGADIPDAPLPPPSSRPTCQPRPSTPGSRIARQSSFEAPVMESRKAPSWGCTSVAPVPTLLHVCAESRAVALRHWPLSFSFCQQPPQIFFRPEDDILYFGPRPGYMAANGQLHTFLCLTNPSDVAKVRRVAIDDSLFWADSGFAGPGAAKSRMGPGPWSYHSLLAISLTVDAIRQMCRRMPDLEEIIFVPQAGGFAFGVSEEDIRDTLRDQVQTAMNDLDAEAGSPRNLPKWTVMGDSMDPVALASSHAFDPKNILAFPLPPRDPWQI